MEGQNRHPVVRQPVEEALPGRDGDVGLVVEAILPGGMLDREQLMRQRIGCDEETVATRDCEGEMPWRVARCRHGRDPGSDLVAVPHQAHAVSDRREIALGLRDDTAEGLGKPRGDIGCRPEIPFRLADDVIRVREVQLACGGFSIPTGGRDVHA